VREGAVLGVGERGWPTTEPRAQEGDRELERDRPRGEHTERGVTGRPRQRSPEGRRESICTTHRRLGRLRRRAAPASRAAGRSPALAACGRRRGPETAP